MERSSYSINFRVRKDKSRKDGTAPVEVSIILNAERASFSTGKKISLKNWDKKKQQVKGQSEEVKLINQFLQTVKNAIYKKELDLLDRGYIITAVGHPSIPVFDRAQWLHIYELSLALCLVLYSELYSSIRSFAVKHGDAVSPDRDLLALGMANILSGLLHGMPVAAGFSATSANEEAGATSRWSGLIAMVVILIAILLFLPVISFIPQPVLAAIIMYAVCRTLNPAIFKPYFTWKRDRLVVCAALGAVLLLGVLEGLLVAISISLVMLLKRFAESKVSMLGRLGTGHDFVELTGSSQAKPGEGVLIFRPDQPLFFANCERVSSEVRSSLSTSEDTTRCVVMSLEETPDIDGSTIEGLNDFFTFVSTHSIYLVLTRLKDPVYSLLSAMIPADSPFIHLSQLSVDDAVEICEEMINTGSLPFRKLV